MTQRTTFTKDRWCVQFGPLCWVWMRRPMGGGTERLMLFSWRSR